MQYIYEAVDETNDEMYWTIGAWLSLDAAISAIAACEMNQLDDNANSSGGSFVVGIRKRCVGFSSRGDTVYRFEWSESYSDHKDEYDWVLKCVDLQKLAKAEQSCR